MRRLAFSKTSFIEILPSSETWTRIASFLSNNDLTHLARTCRFLLTISRTLLYQSVLLRESSTVSHMIETLKLLASDLALAKCIRTFQIMHPQPEEQGLESVQLVVDVLANATSLRGLVIGVTFFHSESQQETFVDYMRNRSSPLEALVYWGQPLPTKSFSIPNLKSICWKGPAEPELWSLLHASRDTIEKLGINMANFPPDVDSAPLWEMCFPNLLEIDLGEADDYDIFERNSTSTFFRAHAFDRKLERVGFHHPIYGECVFVFGESLDGSPPGSPEALQDRQLKVRCLKGAPSFIAHMAEHRLPHVKKVYAIEILHPSDTEDLSEFFFEFDDMVSRISSRSIPQPAFPELVIFCTKFEPFSQKWKYHTTLKADCLRMILGAAVLWAGSLTCWFTVFPPFDISAEELGDAFGYFHSLRAIHLPLQTVGGFEKMEEYALKLAKKCPLLKTVHVTDEQLYPKNFHSLEIARTEFINGRILEDAFKWIF